MQQDYELGNSEINVTDTGIEDAQRSLEYF
jgi:hypothetical protein